MTPTPSAEASPDTVLLKTDIRGRVRLPVERQEALLDEYERSGMSGQGFAKWAGIKYTTFANWRQKRRRKRSADTELIAPCAPQAQSGWVEAVVERSQPVTTGAAARLQIHLPGGMRVEASDPTLAAEFVRALGATGC